MEVTLQVCLATVLFCAIAQLASADQCRYVDCVLEGTSARETEVEMYIANFNNTRHPDDVAAQCSSLLERTARCEREKVNCSDVIYNNWDNRMHDAVYVDFLMSLGTFYCRYPQHLFDLKTCLTQDLQAAIESCVSGNYKFNASCFHDQYNSLENCPDSTDKFFNDIFNRFLTLNPYLTQGSHTHPTPAVSSGSRRQKDGYWKRIIKWL